jgi:hypothetical protein
VERLICAACYFNNSGNDIGGMNEKHKTVLLGVCAERFDEHSGGKVKM